MVWHFSQCDPDYGRRVAEGLGIAVPTSDPGTTAPQHVRVPIAAHGNGANGNGSHGAPIGATGADEAVQQAELVGHDAKPY